MDKLDEIKKIIDTPVDEVEDEEMQEATDSLPENTVKVGKDESEFVMDQNAKPMVYEIKKGDTLKSIAEKFGIDYAELSAYLLRDIGNTSIKEGQDIKIPRHFVDMSRA